MQDADKKNRKQIIYREAARLFREKGYNAASMRELAERVQLKASSLYNHIGSKEEILVKICAQYAAGDVDGATQTFYHACPLIRYENQPGVNMAIRKYIYAQRGAISHAHVRAPSAPLAADVIADLHDIITRLGFGQHMKTKGA
jgi:AcrR family transcriptional regulator